MNKNQIAAARSALLKAEIARTGLTKVAALAGKPVRQINDMAAGRKSFGDGIAKEIGPKIWPDKPREWLVYPEISDSLQTEENAPGTEASKPRSAKTVAFVPLSQRDKDIDEIVRLAKTLDSTGIGMLLRDAQKLAEERPLNVSKTAKSSS